MVNFWTNQAIWKLLKMLPHNSLCLECLHLIIQVDYIILNYSLKLLLYWIGKASQPSSSKPFLAHRGIKHLTNYIVSREISHTGLFVPHGIGGGRQTYGLVGCFEFIIHHNVCSFGFSLNQTLTINSDNFSK